MEIKYISPELIRPNPYQPRVTMETEALQELAASILRNGLLQPPTARALDDGTVELAFGHRRFEAWQLACAQTRQADFPLYIKELTDLEMFEMAVAENMKRRDLNLIEEAEAIRRYMDDFGKTSAEAAEFFHISPERVRGTVRLLNLPEAAKQAIREGTINVTAARSLLTLQHIAGKSPIEKVLQDIATDPTYAPAEAIEEAFRNNSHEIYPNMGWFAPKKFPVKHLSAITKKEIEAALEIDKDTRNEVKEEARRMLELITSGMEVTDESFPYSARRNAMHLDRVRVLANPPACDRCTLHAVMGKKHFCGFEVCADRKREAWKRKEMNDVSRHVGIPLLTPADGEAMSMSTWKDSDQKLYESKHADLRLCEAKHTQYSNFDGLGTQLELVAVGALAEEMKAAKQREDARENGGSDIEKKRMIRQKITADTRFDFYNRFMWEVVSLAFADNFDGTFEYLKFLHKDVIFHTCSPDFPAGLQEDELIEEAQAEYEKGAQVNRVTARKMIGRLIAFNLVDQRFGSIQSQYALKDKKTIILETVNVVKQIAVQWDFKLSSDLDAKAEKYQADLDAELKKALKEVK